MSKLMGNEEIIIFGFFSEKYGKISKNAKIYEKGSDINTKGQNWWKMKKNIIFYWIFSEKYGKKSENTKSDEKGSDIDTKAENW